MTLSLIVLFAVLIDQYFGEPRRWHPLVGFGNLATRLEGWLRSTGSVRPGWQRARGLAAVALAVLPLSLGAGWLAALPVFGPTFSLVLLYLCLGGRSLVLHARHIARPLEQDNLPLARHQTSMIVSRDTSDMSAEDCTKAAVESVLENGNDAVFATLFWFLIGGAPAAVALRLVNTLDAMWGYRTPRYLHFGWAAARLDDLVNWLPARLTALTYALLGRTSDAFWCWRHQARGYDSPNGGPVMAAGAGALGIGLGGLARYQGQWKDRPRLGLGAAPRADAIHAAIRLLQKGICLWVLLVIAVDGLNWTYGPLF